MAARTGTMSAKEILAAQTAILAKQVSEDTYMISADRRIGGKSRTKRREVNVSRQTHECVWKCVSMEHALVWHAASRVKALNPVAAVIAASRATVPETILRALLLWEMVLRQNIRARGIDPSRVRMFKDTSKRPDRPIRRIEEKADPNESKADWVEASNAKVTAMVAEAMRTPGGEGGKRIHTLLQHAMKNREPSVQPIRVAR